MSRNPEKPTADSEDQFPPNPEVPVRGPLSFIQSILGGAFPYTESSFPQLMDTLENEGERWLPTDLAQLPDDESGDTSADT